MSYIHSPSPWGSAARSSNKISRIRTRIEPRTVGSILVSCEESLPSPLPCMQDTETPPIKLRGRGKGSNSILSSDLPILASSRLLYVVLRMQTCCSGVCSGVCRTYTSPYNASDIAPVILYLGTFTMTLAVADPAVNLSKSGSHVVTGNRESRSQHQSPIHYSPFFFAFFPSLPPRRHVQNNS